MGVSWSGLSFDVDVGNAPARHANGFRRHGGILNLSWSADSVTEQIERLAPSQKEVAEDAYFFLISCRRSVVRQHEGSNLRTSCKLATLSVHCGLVFIHSRSGATHFVTDHMRSTQLPRPVTSPRSCPQFWNTENFTSCCISNLTSGCSLGLRKDAVLLNIMELISSTFCGTSARFHMRCTLQTLN